MPTTTTMCYAGDINSSKFELDHNGSAADARATLTAAGFITADTDSAQWRFFVYASKSTNFTDAILAKDLENLVTLGRLLGNGGQLYLTNTAKQTNPDLMGIGADWFFDRAMSCKVTLNNSDKTNNAGKFQPYMLTNVKPTSRNVAGIYDNVVICEKGSSIAFQISSWGAAGFNFSIKPNAGQSIVDCLTICYGPNPNHTASSYTYRYQNAAQQIIVDSTQDLQIPSGQTIQYQRVVVKTWRLTSYEQDGHTYSSDAQPPGLSTSSGAGGGVDQKSLATAGVVPGSSITPGAPHPGDNSNQTFGTIYNTKSDDPDSNPLGEIVIYFFVFKSHADAQAVIGGINAPNPAVWT